MPKRIARKPEETSTEPVATRAKMWLVQFLMLKTEADRIGKRRDELKKRLTEVIEEEGYTDEKGSLYLDLDEPVEGADGKTYEVLKWERRVSRSLNMDKGEALVLSKTYIDKADRQEYPLSKRCIVMVPMLDEEEVLKAYYDGIITEEEIDSIFDDRETFAFKPMEAK